MLKKRKFGASDLHVTELGFGAMSTRPDNTQAVFNAALDAGINFIDTAPDYRAGPDKSRNNEMEIGKHISHRRDEYYLATKCGCAQTSDGQTTHIWTRTQIRKNIEESLRKLNTDYVDVLQLHNPFVLSNDGTPPPIGELIEELRLIQAEGKTRLIGISESAEGVGQALETGAFQSLQIPYSCISPKHHDDIEHAGNEGCGVIIRGRVGREIKDDAIRSGLEAVAGRAGMKPSELVLRYTLNHPSMSTMIVGTNKVEHLNENVAVAQKGPLPNDVFEEVKKVPL